MTDADKPEQTSVNDSGTEAGSDTPLTQVGSRTVLEQTRRDLIALRVAHGADSPIGHRCSNIIELIQMPEVAIGLIDRQVVDLARFRAGLQ
jgi:hypothetical protein